MDQTETNENIVNANVNSDSGNERYAKIFKGISSDLSDADLVKLGTIWDKIESFIVEDLKDGFQIRDIYSLIVAVMNALELFFPGVSGVQLKKYGIYLVKRLITELDERDIIPSEISMMLNFIPIGTIIDLLSNLGKKSLLVNRVSNSNRQSLIESDWVRRNWVCHQPQQEDI